MILGRATLVAVLWSAGALVTARGSAQDDFVRADGTAFVVSGTPFAFVGANVAVMHGPVHRAATETSLDAVVADGATVVRIWALGEYPTDAPAWADDYAFRRDPELFLEAGLAHLDRVLAACRERGLRAIVVLANRWSDYGGLPQYLRWAGVPFTAESALSELEVPRFLASARARALYEAHVTRVVSRVNTVSGLAYRDDPTVLAWELVNEISVPARSRAALVEWLESAAAQIHRIDANHLVSAGHIGYETARDRRTWEAAIGARGIDYADAHAYPTRYGYVHGLEALDRWVADRARTARLIHRPLVFGEVGFTSTMPRVLGVPRARYLDRFFRAARRHGVSGVLPWIYAPSGDHPTEHTLFVDGEVRRTRDLRRVIARHARRFTGYDPRTAPMPPAPGPPRVRVGTRDLHDGWGEHGEGLSLRISPTRYARARFESVGRAEGPRFQHVYGQGAGFVRYRFAAPPRPGASVAFTVRFRGSSELPGEGAGAEPTDTSDVVVRVDDVEIGRARLPVDDGAGALVEIVTRETGALSAITRAGPHTLELAIEDEDAPGLCVYGDATEPTEAPLLEHVELIVER